MSRPMLAVDIDGVISLFGFGKDGAEDAEDPPAEGSARFEVIDGMVHCISVVAGERLQRLSECYELVWASGWEDKANQHLPDLLGVPELPHLNFDGAARFGTADWKLGPLGAYAEGRPLAWVDDSFDEECYRWAKGRAEPTLLIATESHLGLEEAHVERLLDWARSL